MIRKNKTRFANRTFLLGLILVYFSCVEAAPKKIILSGEVRAREAQVLLTPPSQSSPVVLRFYVPDGAKVKKGDVVVRIDPGQALSKLKSLETQVEQLVAKVAKEIAQLEVAALDAERVLLDADALVDKSKVDALIPKKNLAALDYDKYQGVLKRAELDLIQKQRELNIARAAVTRRRDDAKLETSRLIAEREFNAAQVQTAELRAKRDGTVVHAFDNWRGLRFDEGSSAWPGNRIGDLSDTGEVEVIAYALEPERAFLKLNQLTEVRFDAFAGQFFKAKIIEISGAPEPRVEWGYGRYFRVRLETLAPLPKTLLPGMSARVDVQTDESNANSRSPLVKP